MTTTEMPEDVKARLIQAATELMAEQGFEPLSPRDLEIWLTRNAEAVGQRAKDLQDALHVKYLTYQQEITAMISESVYHQIRATK